MKPVSSGTACQVQNWPPCCPALSAHLRHSKLYVLHMRPAQPCHFLSVCVSVCLAMSLCISTWLPESSAYHVLYCIVCLSSAYLPACFLSVYLPICLSVFLPSHRCVRLCVCFPAYLHVCLCTCISIPLLHLPVLFRTYMSACLSVLLSTYM